ncbi:peptide-N4-(N-acetyl-beta-glucosaminyl)asparagine amidase A-like [Tripterygium wilfordii]|uniref:peptide-N4-(N-acetyl-beta- glucosaminyl)asparagine amidase A-like n=1 Tax=Tripterygium wilfordii TaxID=458696 RepID=UPI0018F8205A|nr:peptide-N4-(N-acetyl-beta-glucosaminyl)asparagine amidase A-like [Tripterygium wilfordii]
MASYLFHLLFLILCLNPLTSKANQHKTRNSLIKSDLISQTHFNITPPITFFEVTKPIRIPKTKPCIHRILQNHDFGYTYGKPPVLANYTPPSYCPSQHFSKIVLEWNVTSKGRQYDRIFGVWLGGAELFRSCTAEPTKSGIFWSVKKDITRYYSLLTKNETQSLAVYIGNIIDSTYTGVYHVNLTVYFYPVEEESNSYVMHHNVFESKSRDGSRADLIIPISRNLPLNDGLWFEIQNSTDFASKEFEIPQNVYRAVLEVYVSFHEKDEFWYGNPPDEYIVANNVADDIDGNGPFREVLIKLDGVMVGAIWPFTVVFTGGVSPFLWRPISGIGSFDLPSYDIEITPFLGTILDGKVHELGFSVTNALNVWYIDANLHLWLDHRSMKTRGKLLEHNHMPLVTSSSSKFKGLDGEFMTNVKRVISSKGWVESSYGKIATRFNQNFDYSNVMEMSNNGSSQIVNQVIHFNDSVEAEMPWKKTYSTKSLKKFLLYMNTNNLDQGDGTTSSVAKLTLGFNEKNYLHKYAIRSIENLQNGQASMVFKKNLALIGVGSTKQTYRFKDDKFCYSRNISSSNYTILYDELGNGCHERMKSGLSFVVGR